MGQVLVKNRNSQWSIEAAGSLKKIGDSLKNTVRKEDLEKILGDFEKRILQRIPAKQATPIHEMAVQDKRQINKQLRFMLSHTERDIMTPTVQQEAKALGISTGAAGGFLVPEEFHAEVLRKLIKRSVIRPNAREFNGVGQKGTMPRETGTVSIVWEGENIANAETVNPTFGQVAWSLNKMKGLTKVPLELLRNEAMDVVSLLSDMFAEQMEVAEDLVFMTGTGSNQPTGLRTLTTGFVTVAQAGLHLIYDDLVSIKHTLKVQYRKEAVWLMNNAAIQIVAKIKDANGRPIFMNYWDPAAVRNNEVIPDQTLGYLLGNPVFEQANIPNNLGAGNNATEIWFTNLKRGYGIFDQGTIEMSSTTEGFGTFESDQVAVKVIKWVDGKALIPEANCYGSGIIA